MTRFAEFVARKTREAQTAVLRPLSTLDDRSRLFASSPIGNDWTRRLYDGVFHLLRAPDPSMPAVSLVFVRSREGNTGANDPAELGGGPTDKHLIYEGLSRVAADGVLAGAKTAEGEVFFSIWRPELVALREELGLPRHPAQVIVTGRACVDIEHTLIFNVPEQRVFIVGSRYACGVLAGALAARPWVTLVPMEGDTLRNPLRHLRERWGIRRICCIGGRTTATTLIDEGLVQDVCLTTTERSAGEPYTPFYAGKRPPDLDSIVRKRGCDPGEPMTFEHLAVRSEVLKGAEGC